MPGLDRIWWEMVCALSRYIGIAYVTAEGLAVDIGV